MAKSKKTPVDPEMVPPDKEVEPVEEMPPDVLAAAPVIKMVGRELPVLECPETGKAEAKVDPPILVFLRLAPSPTMPSGALMPGKVIAAECNSGRSGNARDLGEPIACANPGQTVYLVETAEQTLSAPAVRGTFTAGQLQVRG